MKKLMLFLVLVAFVAVNVSPVKALVVKSKSAVVLQQNQNDKTTKTEAKDTKATTTEKKCCPNSGDKKCNHGEKDKKCSHGEKDKKCKSEGTGCSKKCEKKCTHAAGTEKK